jgi:hypothetical protein
MNFCSQLPEPHVIMYVSSLRVLTYDCALCTWIPSIAQHEKRTYAILLWPWECLDLGIQNFNHDSPIIMSFLSTCIFPPTPCPQTCWSTRIFFVLISLSWLFQTCNHELILLTQNVHLAPSTQQAEQAGFTRAEITRRASQFSLKINKRQSS